MIEIRALPDLYSMLLTWMALGLLFLLLRHFLYEPVSGLLNDRKERIQSNIEEAKTLKEEAENLRTSYESKISLAKKDGQGILETARKRGEELRQGIIEDARLDAEKIKNKALNETIREKERSFQNVKSQAGEMAVMIASKLLGSQIDEEEHKILIDNFIDELGNQEWQV